MASLKAFRSGPIALTNTLTTNLLNPAAATGGVNGGSSGQYIIVRQIHVVNKTGGAATFSLWLGATGANAAGTEVFNAQSVAAQSTYVYPCLLRLDTGDFLVGGASANTTLTMHIQGEVGVA